MELEAPACGEVHAQDPAGSRKQLPLARQRHVPPDGQVDYERNRSRRVLVAIPDPKRNLRRRRKRGCEEERDPERMGRPARQGEVVRRDLDPIEANRRSIDRDLEPLGRRLLEKTRDLPLFEIVEDAVPVSIEERANAKRLFARVHVVRHEDEDAIALDSESERLREFERMRLGTPNQSSERGARQRREETRAAHDGPSLHGEGAGGKMPA